MILFVEQFESISGSLSTWYGTLNSEWKFKSFEHNFPVNQLIQAELGQD